MHIPVLLKETLDYLAIRPDGVYLDATAGMGGHTAAIARLLDTGLVVSADRDAESLEFARHNCSDVIERIRFVQTPFSGLPQSLLRLGVGSLDGVLADLGVSRYQLTDPDRGFSLMSEGPVDMRMDRTQDRTAADLVNYTAEKELANLIFQLGEERRARRVARAIVRARPIRSTAHLAQVIESAVPRTGRIHPATRTFMALRLSVNEELEELGSLLENAPRLVKSGGRIVVLTFMSLEDRKVKQRFQSLSREGKASILTKHVVRPSEAEIERNPASRSAMLRAVEMK